MSTRESFIRALEDGNRQSIVQFIKQHNDKSVEFCMQDIFSVTGQKQLEQAWSSVHILCSAVLLEYSAAEDHSAPECKEQLELLSGVVQMASILTDVQSSLSMLYDTTFLLNSVLLHLENATQLQSAIGRLSELWWTSSLTNREELAPNLIAFLLQSTLSSKKAMVKDLKVLWKLRECLQHIDPTDEAILELLKRAFASSLFISRDMGKKFLSEVLLLKVDLIPVFHSVILNELSYASKDKISSYGSIFVRAWRESEGEMREAIESKMIQPMMSQAIHCKRRVLSLKMGPSTIMRKVLDAFHSQKALDGMDDMLYRLYEPLLWRALKMPNADVRANSASLLIDAFPLHHPTQSAEERDASYQKQFDVLKDLLYDSCPEVRCIAVQGVCRICNVFWEVIPMPTICNFLGILTDDHSCDVSSDDVRLAVVTGMTHLLDNFLAHPLLNTLLPKLRNRFHDQAEKVRLAFVVLLDKVKTIKSIKYWQVVPIEHLLARLAIDTPKVAKALTKMLMPTFWPTDKPPQEQLMRCMTLCQEQPAAARVFFSHAYKFLSLPDCAKYILSICNLLLFTVAQHRKKQGTLPGDNTLVDSDTEEKENAEDSKQDEKEGDYVFTLDDVMTVAGLLETIIVLRMGIDESLSKHGDSTLANKLQEKIALVVCKLFPEVYSKRVTNALSVLAGFVPSRLVPVVSMKAMSRLRKHTTADAAASCNESDLKPLLDNILSWNRWNELLDLIEEWLKTALDLDASFTAEVGQGRVGFADEEPAVDQNACLQSAVEYMNHILSKASSRDILLKTEKLTKFKSIMDVLSNIKVVIGNHLSGQTSELSEDSIGKAFSLYMTSIVYIHGHDSDFNQSLASLLKWVEPILLPSLRPNIQPKKRKRKLLGAAETTLLADADTTAITAAETTVLNATVLDETLVASTRNNESDLAVTILKNFIFMCWNSLGSGVCSLESTSTLCQFALNLLRIDEKLLLLKDNVCLIRYAVTSALLVHSDVASNGLQGHIHFVSSTLAQCVGLLLHLSQKKNTEELNAVLKSIRPDFHEALNEYFSLYDFYDHEVKTQPLRECVKVVTMETTDAVTKDSELEAANCVSSMRPLSSFIVNFFCKKHAHLLLLTHHLALSPGDVIEIEHLVALLHVLHPIAVQFASSKWLRKDAPIHGHLQTLLLEIRTRLQSVQAQDDDDSLKSLLLRSQTLIEDTCSTLKIQI